MEKPALAPAVDPLWYKDAVIYQLHPKSFFDANGDGVGDFPGLTAKLDYIAELGVDAIWVLPFYPSPRLDDGYDIAQYKAVHPEYGVMADVKRFIKEAHARGIRVITELVINHTSDKHPWFERARKAKPGSKYRDFYVWSDNDQAYAGTRIIFCDTEKSNWTWDPVAGAYFWHRFYSHQPDLNFDNPAVLEEVLNVMRFWLDLGVDGLRLDAIPYLVEREGTSNENLPETHAVLKKIRAHLDEHYTGRVLLAEANQWPEDVRDYFGDGDQCHMAFHFPLMPRMYMAIAQEDRFPITDILRQTPAIPDNAQWALFLRNHDELTLEMVTDKERDYLWDTYADDRRARLNLGIRRRLAPLLQRDRRRIELMTSLLLSLPGTPIIYYGDEIGMGDNIHLGDRHGVRTPMQWSADRNGGFSRADPEKLVLPPIMDSLYGYEAVNVEAQSRDPHSLLNWTRRMLATRKQHHAFGRGTLTFLRPGNRKVLAYLREHEGTAILCVANLCRTPQAVELDLARFAGYVPVEMTGASPFPEIGQLTYLLTLPPYGFYWFELRQNVEGPSWKTPAPEQMKEYTTLVLRRGLDDVLAEPSLTDLLKNILPEYLPLRRWFASKDGVIEDVRVAGSVALHHGKCEMLLTGLDVDVAGRTERYALPLGIIWEDDIVSPLPQQLALARVRQGRRVGFLTDAFSVADFATTILERMKTSADLEIGEGRSLRFRASSSLTDTPPGLDATALRWLTTEQSNSSLTIDSAIVLKLIRKIASGIHPEVEMSRHLTKLGFENVAPFLGDVVRIDATGEATIAILQGFIQNQGDAWTWTIDYLNRVMNERALADLDRGDEFDPLEEYDQFAVTVGRRLGELHALLARPSDDPDFDPESVGEEDLKEWRAKVVALLAQAFDQLTVHEEWADAGTETTVSALLARRDELLSAVSALAGNERGALCTRIHGDLHLGQILVSQGDAVFIDFEGETARPIDERRRKASPLRDVAGLLRSFDYAAASVETVQGEPLPPPAAELRGALIADFRARAAAAFMCGYDEALERASRPWVGAEGRDALIDLFLLEKAAYEILYEAANRPLWVGIPVQGLAALAERLLAQTVEETPHG
ncbi:MAG: maltose alpha-D-glucosyltransferase [Parvibaculum sp.]|uniref:maltose alpha-D-glucosyltransferase n=1 Tax=Parvibaculum sp. TaxID=2024848 RepID=UPI0025EDBA5C|nr:maltose alpha-D-glucosyltransferase [Parvibaculum sp.]MCE9649792.1 maltose alpha-D-glucosyltransferase [Parvibaculum sp.]